MPENRAHAATSGRIAVNSERDRKAAELNGDRKAVSRLLIVACVALLWMTAVLGRLGYLQLFLHSEYMARAQRQQQRVIEITPKRGAIYDRNMHPLAMSIPVDSAFAVPSELGDEQLAARLLSSTSKKKISAFIRSATWRRMCWALSISMKKAWAGSNTNWMVRSGARAKRLS